jgi:hypothetical protein
MARISPAINRGDKCKSELKLTVNQNFKHIQLLKTKLFLNKIIEADCKAHPAYSMGARGLFQGT